MTLPRSQLVSVDDTLWYHCVSRCVRRAFLCGKDKETGRDFTHRRGWIAKRIRELSAVFCIDIAAYAVMSNHYHIVLHINREKALALSDEEVLKRWTSLFKGPDIIRSYLVPHERGQMSHSELLAVKTITEELRKRLYDLSWYMRCLNEYVARMANKEDKVKGRFWEGRYKSQAILDEKALLAAMAYVDLNPVRAGIADTPEKSEFTSIKERIDSIKKQKQKIKSSDSGKKRKTGGLEKKLMPFADTGFSEISIPFGFTEYLELVDWTGRAIRKENAGYIDDAKPKIFGRLNMDVKGFMAFADCFLKEFGHAVGAPQSLINLCAGRNIRHLKGINTARAVFEYKKAA